MPKLIDLTGSKIGELTIISRAESNIPRRTFWVCKCSCGNECIARGDQIKSGHTVSCGCVSKKRLAEQREKHGKCYSRIYKIWIGMKKRCSSKNDERYKDYGGRGISVCNEWLNFEKFYEDMGDPPNNTSLDRIDVNGNYCKENCRWATNKEQALNKRNSIRIDYDGKERTLEELSELLNIKLVTLYSRIVVYKWSINDALTRPVAPHKYDLPCSICGAKHFAKGFCKKHYNDHYHAMTRKKKGQAA